MPIYEYKCESCGIVFERMQHFDDKQLQECPECGGPLRRVLQPVGIIFRGSGFYVTDNRQVSSGVSRSQKQLPEPKTAEKQALPAAEGNKAKKKEATG
jgi:putative FmdB family regulatory protein